MIDLSALFIRVSKAQNDADWAVREEVERHRPSFQREQRLRVIGLLLAGAILLLALLMGWSVHWRLVRVHGCTDRQQLHRSATMMKIRIPSEGRLFHYAKPI